MNPFRTMSSARPLRLASLAAALVLSGCMGAPLAPADPHAGVAVPAAFAQAGAGAPSWTTAPPAEAQPRGAWWLAFQDPVLNALVERAGDANTDVRQAAARLAEARALLRSADADRAPQLGVSTGVTRQAGANTSGGATPATLGTAGLNASYELDLFGRLARASDAARLDAEARAALLRSTRLLVQADVAQTYLQLRSVQAERVLVDESLAAYRGTLHLTQRRYQAGDVAELDLARVRTEVAATEAEALALERQQVLLQNALAVLAGDVAGGFAVAPAPGDAVLPVVPAGVPGTVLARRPDVSAAQAAVLAAQARVGVAQAAWFPAVTLTGSGGYASPELGDLFRWSSRAWSVGALLSLPLFDGGRRAAQEEGARARLDEALAAHRGQVLAAFREVEDQLGSLRLLAAQAEAQGRAVDASARATQLSDSRYRNGFVSQLELLDARRSELRNRRQALQVRTAQYTATVGLIRALGGGWGEEAATAGAAPAGTAVARAPGAGPASE
ncbi:efflux transporter outer membrane subunit [Acidovorax sp. NCPPB 2350]|nr:efflux transporter outer membrane subunit [Acidovorax sp. NCPPB 2350]